MTALSFAKEIRPLFRDEPDIGAMKDFGLDLSSYAHVDFRLLYLIDIL